MSDVFHHQCVYVCVRIRKSYQCMFACTYMKRCAVGSRADLVQIQSPDFNPGWDWLVLADPQDWATTEAASSLDAPHLKQLGRLAKLWTPHAQRQSPGFTSQLAFPLPRSPSSPPTFAFLHRWHDSRQQKLSYWHDRHIQSPAFRLIFSLALSSIC